MTEIAIGLTIGVGSGLIIALISALIRRADVQTKQDRIVKAIEDLQDGQKKTIQILHPLIVSLEGAQPNGELHKAREILNDYLLNK